MKKVILALAIIALTVIPALAGEQEDAKVNQLVDHWKAVNFDLQQHADKARAELAKTEAELKEALKAQEAANLKAATEKANKGAEKEKKK
jgi:hypothetical protein